MKVLDYIGFYGSVFMIMAAIGLLIKARYPDAVEDSFIAGHGGLGFSLLLCVVIGTLCNLVEWVVHFFR